MKDATLCFLVKESEKEILLGMKKRGFGQGKYNGFGGKIGDNETREKAAVRELYEETGVKVEPQHLTKAAELNFVFLGKPEWNQTVYVFLAKEWTGMPTESEEMTAAWMKYQDIPYQQMWKDDVYWLPRVLQGLKLNGKFVFKEDNESIAEYELLENDILLEKRRF